MEHGQTAIRKQPADNTEIPRHNGLKKKDIKSIG